MLVLMVYLKECLVSESVSQLGQEVSTRNGQFFVKNEQDCEHQIAFCGAKRAIKEHHITSSKQVQAKLASQDHLHIRMIYTEPRELTMLFCYVVEYIPYV
jgi:hypothetical protein